MYYLIGYEMRKIRRNTIMKHFPHISDARLEQLVDFSFEINVKSIIKELSIINKWMLRIGKTIDDLTIDEIRNIYKRKISRREHLILNNKRIDIVDRSLVEVFIQDKGLAEQLYTDMCMNKTHKMRETVKENPNLLRTGAFDHCIKKFDGDVELAEKYYRDLNKRKGYSVSVQRFLDMGHDETTAILLRKQRQSTFSLQKCIASHGSELGYAIWKNRQDRWISKLNSRSDEEIKLSDQKKGQSISGYMARGYSEAEAVDMLTNFLSKRVGYSQESIRLFKSSFPSTILNVALFAEREFFLYDYEYKRRYYYDFVYNGVVIEYHGEAFHPNPSVLTESEWNNWKHPYKKTSATEVYEYDMRKKTVAIESGFCFFEIYSNMSDSEITDVINQSKLIMLSRSNFS